MRIGIVLFFIAAAVMANIYTEGRLLKSLFKYKKYYQMVGVGFAALAIYVLFTKNPQRARDLVMTSNEYLKYMPVDKNATNILNPILDFTSKYGGEIDSNPYPILNLGANDHAQGRHTYADGRQTYANGRQTYANGRQTYAESRITKSGVPVIGSQVKATKRSVSETKKKYVAAQQGWKCGHCKKQLPAWFEVDHKIRLEHGGSNHIDNLVALCRDCHGEKTAMENL
jgi:hypothetical protein